MKNTFFIVMILFLYSIVFANDFMKPVHEKIPLSIDNLMRTKLIRPANSRDVPQWEFVVDPVNLLTNYYDYMPGSYNSTPVRIQPADVGGGVYITYHAREAAYSTRRVYYAYIDEGVSVTVAHIGFNDLHEGYSGVDIDPVTGDPFCAWHVNIDGSGDLEVVCTYDTYHILQNPGLWLTPFVVMDDTTPQPYGPTDEFIWPYIHIGPSPDPYKRRVYVVANNGDSTPTGSPSENILLAYADFNEADLNNQSTLDWSYNTIPLLDEWHMGIPEWIRPSQSFDVSKTDGKVALFGYNSNDEIYVFLNDNYGEGDFTYISENYQFDVWNPQNLDGSYYFTDENGDPYTLYWSFLYSNHMTSIFTEGSNKLNFGGSFGLQCYEGFHWPFWNFPKAFQYDLNTQEFSFHDLYITGANPDDNIPMVPWDLDENGLVDSYDPNGNAAHVHDWPIWFWSTDVAFHENNMKMTSNDDNGWLVNIWQDGLKSKYYNDWGDPDYIDWAEIAEIMISISSDGGATWSEPIIMNSLVGDENYVTQLDGMMPAYVYCGDKIEDLGDGWGEVHLFFLDDYSYGSYIMGNGDNLGGMMEYASIKINFGIPNLIADFSGNPTSGISPLEVQFTDLSIGSIISWEWDFDNDGTIDSYEQNPNYTYVLQGDYTVSLTVSDGTDQDTETKYNYITVFNSVNADFSADPTSGTVPLDVQFTDLSTGSIVSWEWDFDNDGVIDSYEQNPNYTYVLQGDHTVSLTVYDVVNQHTETKTDYISVIGPTADFEADSTFGYCPLEVQFTDLSTGSIVSWEWDFDNDGVIDSYTQNPVYTYAVPDTFSVTLFIFDGTYSDQITKTDYIIVNEVVEADFIAEPTSGAIPLEVQFTDLSAGNIVGRLWDFNYDGTIDSNEPNPTYIYETPGIYTVSLCVTDGVTDDTEIKIDYINVTQSGVGEILPPAQTKLYMNYPNPFNPSTSIRFDVKENEKGIISIYNIKGEIVESKKFITGRHLFEWNASEYSSGIYFLKLKTDTYSKVKKMMLLK